MGFQTRTNILAGAIVLFFSASAFAEDAAAVKVDADAAKELARTDHCLRCHAINKKKEGPSYHDIATKYKGHPEAQENLVKHITSGEDVVELTDGHHELHKFDKDTNVEQINNMVRWILAQ